MGRLTNAVGLRLGRTIQWSSYGIKLKKAYCIANFNFIDNLTKIIELGVLQDKGYLLAKIRILQEKEIAQLQLFFYVDKILFTRPFTGILYSKLLKRYKCLNKVKLNKQRKLTVPKGNFRFGKHKLKLKSMWLQIKDKNSKQRGWKKKTGSLSKKYLILRKKVNKAFYKKYKKLKVIKKKVKQFIWNKFEIKKVMSRKDVFSRRLHRLYKKEKQISHTISAWRVGKDTFLKKKYVKHLVNAFNKKVLLLSKQNTFAQDNLKILNYINSIGLIPTYTRKYYVNILKKLSLIFIIKEKSNIFKQYVKLLLLSKLKGHIYKQIGKNKKQYITRYVAADRSTEKDVYSTNIQYKLLYKLIGKSYSFLYKNGSLKSQANFLHRKKLEFLKVALEWIMLERAALQLAKQYFLKDISCNFFFINDFQYTAKVLAKYICIKLKQRFTLTQVIWPLLRFLDKLISKHYLEGYRVEAMGRFTRKQRATVLVIKKGCVPLATITSKIEYAENFVSLKDGVGGIKLWLNKTIKGKQYKTSLRSL